MTLYRRTRSRTSSVSEIVFSPPLDCFLLLFLFLLCVTRSPTVCWTAPALVQNQPPIQSCSSLRGVTDPPFRPRPPDSDGGVGVGGGLQSRFKAAFATNLRHREFVRHAADLRGQTVRRPVLWFSTSRGFDLRLCSGSFRIHAQRPKASDQDSFQPRLHEKKKKQRMCFFNVGFSANAGVASPFKVSSERAGRPQLPALVIGSPCTAPPGRCGSPCRGRGAGIWRWSRRS